MGFEAYVEKEQQIEENLRPQKLLQEISLLLPQHRLGFNDLPRFKDFDTAGADFERSWNNVFKSPERLAWLENFAAESKAKMKAALPPEYGIDMLNDVDKFKEFATSDNTAARGAMYEAARNIRDELNAKADEYWNQDLSKQEASPEGKAA